LNPFAWTFHAKNAKGFAKNAKGNYSKHYLWLKIGGVELLRKVIFVTVLSFALSTPLISFAQDTAINQKDSICISYDQAPEPKGGFENLIEKMPISNIDLDSPVNLKIYVSMLVDKNGTLSDLKIIKGNDPYGIGAKVIENLQKSSPWIPAKLNGKAVKVRYVVPVKFALP